MCVCDSGSQKVQHLFGGFKRKIKNCSTIRMNKMKNSSDLERAPGARSIGDEFYVLFIRVAELQRCENSSNSRSRCTFWDPESSVLRKTCSYTTYLT